METITRNRVAKRENFLKNYYQPGKKFCELGKEKYLKNKKALSLLVQLQNRYPDEKDFAIEPVELSWEMVTGNGKYSLD